VWSSPGMSLIRFPRFGFDKSVIVASVLLVLGSQESKNPWRLGPAITGMEPARGSSCHFLCILRKKTNKRERHMIAGDSSGYLGAPSEGRSSEEWPNSELGCV
jgi:hypothetical protein